MRQLKSGRILRGNFGRNGLRERSVRESSKNGRQSFWNGREFSRFLIDRWFSKLFVEVQKIPKSLRNSKFGRTPEAPDLVEENFVFVLFKRRRNKNVLQAFLWNTNLRISCFADCSPLSRVCSLAVALTTTKHCRLFLKGSSGAFLGSIGTKAKISSWSLVHWRHLWGLWSSNAVNLTEFLVSMARVKKIDRFSHFIRKLCRKIFSPDPPFYCTSNPTISQSGVCSIRQKWSRE